MVLHMCNVLLILQHAGVVKSQWYPLWIKKEAALRRDTTKKTRELHDIHDILKEVW